MQRIMIHRNSKMVGQRSGVTHFWKRRKIKTRKMKGKKRGKRLSFRDKDAKHKNARLPYGQKKLI